MAYGLRPLQRSQPAPPQWQVFGAAAGGPHFVLLHMGKLPLDHIGREAVFIQHIGCQAAEAVWGGDTAVTHTPHGIAQGVFTVWLGRVLAVGKLLFCLFTRRPCFGKTDSGVSAN